MHVKKPYLAALAAAVLMVSSGLRAADPPQNPDDRIRAELRDTILQLRTAQSDLAALQSQQAAAAEEKTALQAKNDGLRKQLAALEAAGERTTAELGAQISALKAENAKLSTALTKTRADVDKYSGEAQSEADKAARLRSQVIVLHRKVSDLESKNLALFLLGNEILTRYDQFGLGASIAAKEPFVGSARTRLENLVQEYQDKLSDARARN
jgi:chromosome segregation ATPase